MPVPSKLSLPLARKIINGMIAFAKDNMLMPGSYAVVDEGGHLVAFERRDGAPAATADIAIDKAWTAAVMKASGRMLEVITRGQGWRLNIKHRGRLTIIPGTVPVIAHGRVIGGIGHSGESAENDLRIAQAGLAAFYREDDIVVTVEKLLGLARSIADEAIRIINSYGFSPSSIAIVDEWGELVLLYRMDGSSYVTPEIARNKAWTAAAIKSYSEDAVSLCGETWLASCNSGWNERLLPLPGGIFFEAEGVKAAIGVSGNKPEEDRKIAIDALRRLGIIK